MKVTSPENEDNLSQNEDDLIQNKNTTLSKKWRQPEAKVDRSVGLKGGVSQLRTEPLSNPKAKVDQSEFSVFI